MPYANAILVVLLFAVALLYGGVAWFLFGWGWGWGIGVFVVMFLLMLLMFGLCDMAASDAREEQI